MSVAVFLLHFYHNFGVDCDSFHVSSGFVLAFSIAKWIRSLGLRAGVYGRFDPLNFAFASCLLCLRASCVSRSLKKFFYTVCLRML